jgi:hypothetical protein
LNPSLCPSLILAQMEFAPNGTFVRAFEQPNAVLPRLGDATLWLNSIGPHAEDISSGRQSNLGYEGPCCCR